MTNPYLLSYGVSQGTLFIFPEYVYLLPSEDVRFSHILWGHNLFSLNFWDRHPLPSEYLSRYIGVHINKLFVHSIKFNNLFLPGFLLYMWKSHVIKGSRRHYFMVLTDRNRCLYMTEWQDLRRSGSSFIVFPTKDGFRHSFPRQSLERGTEHLPEEEDKEVW